MRKRDSKNAKSAVWNNNYYIRSPYKADKVFIHHMVAVGWTGKRCGEFFKGAGVSSNYGIGVKGDVCQYVEEKYGAYAQGSKRWNQRGISIECANNSANGWTISDDTLDACIELVVDIFKRNGWGNVVYTGDLSGNLCMHRWVANTTCPGTYLGKKFSHIADKANEIMAGEIVLHERGYYKKGDFGYGVLNLKRWLKKQGFYKGKYMNRSYSTAMVKAVKRFQKKYGLKVDGEWGKECMKKYKELTK